MRVVIFGAERRVGAWVEDQVVDLNSAYARHLQQQGRPFAEETAKVRLPANLEQFIALGPSAIDDAQRAIDVAISAGLDSGLTQLAATAQIHAPWPGRRIACAGGNYAEHLLGLVGHRPGHEDATAESIARSTRDAGQWGFWKVPDAVTGPDGDVPFPSHSDYFDYEGELAIIIGRRGKNISAGEIDQYVWGVTLVNDWSKRGASTSPNRPVSYNTAKNFDGSTSMGPCIVLGDIDYQDVEVETRVNGDVRQSYSTAGMIFSFGEILEHLSVDFTFVPGDVISAGTDAGTAADRTTPSADGSRATDLFLKVGDVVEVSSPRIGTLRNAIVAAG
jgi:2-keto-4-pentenoate hydratase/2-oxohepta-3-ene-1,7-dioic acid hydratase in catechol pathway